MTKHSCTPETMFVTISLVPINSGKPLVFAAVLPDFPRTCGNKPKDVCVQQAVDVIKDNVFDFLTKNLTTRHRLRDHVVVLTLMRFCSKCGEKVGGVGVFNISLNSFDLKEQLPITQKAVWDQLAEALMYHFNAKFQEAAILAQITL